MNGATSDPRIADIVKAGAIRLALFLPQFTKTAAGELTPLGAGHVARSLIGVLAERLGVAMEIVEQPSPPKAIETLNAGGCDVIILGFEEARAKLVDFTPGVVRFDFAYLVPAGSSIEEIAEVDCPGHRISVPKGHASWMALKGLIEHAEIVETDLPDQAFELLRDGKADVFALPREQLMDYAERLRGSRILAQGFGFNVACFAVAKGRSQLLDVISEFVEETRASGLVGRILESADLTSRGFDVPGGSD